MNPDGARQAHPPALAADRVPMVTVIIPAYGVNAYIREAIDSVLGQTFTDREVVVVNDGAPAQESAELLEIVRSYGGRVGYLERVNGGQGAARNTAMRASRSEFVAFLDGDDYWTPAFLEHQMDVLHADPELALVYSDARIFGDTVAAGSTYMDRDPSTGDVTLESLLAGRCSVAMSTIVARRSRIAEAGWFDERLRYSEDFDLWFRMAHRGMRIAYRREALTYRRVRADALSANDVKLNSVALEVLERFGREHPLSEAEEDAMHSSMARLRSDIALAEAKRGLVGQEYRAASMRLRELGPGFANWKVRWARLGLRVLPMAVRAGYLMLQRLYRLRQRRHVARIDRANASEGRHTAVASDSRAPARRPDDRRPSVTEV